MRVMEPFDPTTRSAEAGSGVDVEMRSLFVEALAVSQEIAEWDGGEPGLAALEQRLAEIEARIAALEAYARNARQLQG